MKIIVAALALAPATAFSVTQSSQRHAGTALCAEHAPRRAFLTAAFTAAVGVAVASPAFAADEDLSMPAAVTDWKSSDLTEVGTCCARFFVLDKEPLTRLLAGVSHPTITMTNCSTGEYSQRAERLTVIAEAFLLVKATSIPSLETFFMIL
jgi:hypothetical protein